MSQRFIQLEQINKTSEDSIKLNTENLPLLGDIYDKLQFLNITFLRIHSHKKEQGTSFAVSESEVLRWKWKPFPALEYICSQLPIHIHTSQHSNSVQRWQKALPVRALAPVIALLKSIRSTRLLLSQSTWDHMPGWTVQLEFNLLIFCSFRT